MKFIFLLFLFIVNSAVYAQTSTKIEELEARLDDIELRQAVQKFHFSGSFENHFESFSSVSNSTELFENEPEPFKTGLIAANSSRNETVTPMIMDVKLNFDATVNKNLNFYSTVAMSKFWNMSGRDSRDNFNNDNFESLSGHYALRDSNAHFDVAYLRYNKDSSPWTIAIGRMPTNNGPPVNQQYGTARSGTYPFLSFNVLADGLATIYNFKNHLPSKHSLKMRLFYTPFILLSSSDRGTQITETNSGEKVDSSASILTLLTEYSLRQISWADRLDIFHTAYKIDNFFDQSFQKLEGTAPAPAFEKYYGDGIEYSDIISNTIYIGAKNISNTNINLSLSLNHIAFIRDSENSSSENYLATINYKFDNTFNPGDILGIEYMNTDENKYPTDQTTLYVNDFYNMLNGEGIHLFYTKSIGVNQLIRLGYFSYKEGESELFSVNQETKETSTYLKWKVFF